MKKIILTVLALCLSPLYGQAVELELSADAFEGSFTIDATHTTDGKTYEVSASGEAGPYGRVYLSYVFTDKQEQGDRGEFTGFAWAQNGEDVATATLQGVYIKDAGVFRMYTLDLDSTGKINFAKGVADFVAKTMVFNAAEVETGI